MWIITVISLILLLLYLAKIHGYKRNWKHYPEILPDGGRLSTTLSVIIAFRNESSHLPALLNALAAQDYPASLYEVILVNDRSEDDSASIASDYCIRHKNFVLWHAGDLEIGKKIITQIRALNPSVLLTVGAKASEIALGHLLLGHGEARR